MLLYLETRDLINIFEKSQPLAGERLLSLLRSGRHSLVVSFPHVAELAAPLQHTNAKTNVARLLNSLEELPLDFIADSKLEFLEYREALESWQAGRECRPIDPFVPRIDYTLPFDGLPPTHLQLTSSLAELVFQLWLEVPHVFDGHRQHLELLVGAVDRDRKLAALPNLRQHFANPLRKRLEQFGLPTPRDLEAFSYWLYDEPARCPFARLSLEIYRLIVLDRSFTPKASLFEDYSHVKSLPYVDLMTLDRQMASYVTSACKAAGLPYHSRIQTNVAEAIRLLEG